MKLDISIIIPVYNVAHYLPRCIDSLLKQNFPGKYEVILIDDGSKDNSRTIAQGYVKNYSHILKLFCKDNGGQGSARNLGIEYATGEYIAFVDSDDYVDSSYLDILYNLAKTTNSDISMCASNRCYGDDGKGKRFDSGFTQNFVSNDIEKILISSSFSPWNKLYKRDLFIDLRFPIGMTYEDFALIPQVMYRAHRIAYTNKVLYHYFVNQNSTIMSQKNSTDYNIIKAQHILEESELKNQKLLLSIFFIRRVICSMCFALLSNDNNINAVKILIKEGKSKYNLKSAKSSIKLGLIDTIFINLVIDENYWLSFAWAKLIKFLKRLSTYIKRIIQ